MYKIPLLNSFGFFIKNIREKTQNFIFSLTVAIAQMKSIFAYEKGKIHLLKEQTTKKGKNSLFNGSLLKYQRKLYQVK